MKGEQRRRFRIKQDDIVMVVTGKEKGKRGKVLRVFPDKMKVLVERLNMVYRHTRPTTQLQQGGIIEKEAPLHISNVMVVCPKCDKPVRTKKKQLEDGKRVRICIKCKELIDVK